MSRKIDAIERELGEQLKLARLASGKSVQQLATELGVNRAYWYMAERGEVSLRAYEKLAKAVAMRLEIVARLVPPQKRGE